MKVLVQWTTSAPGDWTEYDITQANYANAIASLPKKGEPTGGENIDRKLGWIFAINVQGITFMGMDHYSVEIDSTGTGLVICAWNDDPEDYPVGTREAMRWTLLPPAPDPALGGVVNTRQFPEFYADAGSPWNGVLPNVRPYEEFVKPPLIATFHGIWASQALTDEHRAKQSLRGWEEWK